MDSDSSVRNLPDEFNLQLNALRQRMTYQLLLDLKNLEDTIQSTQPQNKPIQPQNKTIQQQQQILVGIYQKHINQLQKIQSSVDVKIKFEELQADLSLVQSLEQFNHDCDIPATIKLFENLIEKQQRVIVNIEEYINALCERIQHERYVHEQEGICQKLRKQIYVFKVRKEELRAIIQNANAQRKQWYHMAINVCRDKQVQIEQLQALKSQQQEEVQKQKLKTIQLNQKQEELYRMISKVTLELNINSLKSAKSDHIEQLNKPLDAPSEKEFKSKNFGSAIEPMPISQTQNPSLIFSQQNYSSSQTNAPTCLVQSGIEKELNKRKFTILTLFMLSILLISATFFIKKM